MSLIYLFSRELKVDYKTVGKWIKRVLDPGVKEGLADKSRSGKPQDISAGIKHEQLSFNVNSLYHKMPTKEGKIKISARIPKSLYV